MQLSRSCESPVETRCRERLIGLGYREIADANIKSQRRFQLAAGPAGIYFRGETELTNLYRDEPILTIGATGEAREKGIVKGESARD